MAVINFLKKRQEKLTPFGWPKESRVYDPLVKSATAPKVINHNYPAKYRMKCALPYVNISIYIWGGIKRWFGMTVVRVKGSQVDASDTFSRLYSPLMYYAKVSVQWRGNPGKLGGLENTVSTREKRKLGSIAFSGDGNRHHTFSLAHVSLKDRENVCAKISISMRPLYTSYPRNSFSRGWKKYISPV